MKVSYIVSLFTLVVVWWSMSAISNVINKSIMKEEHGGFCSIRTFESSNVMAVILYILLHKRIQLHFTRQHLYMVICHSLASWAVIMSFTGGKVKLVQVIKAIEPFLNVFWATWVLKETISMESIFSIFIVVFGIIIACVHDTSYTWSALILALFSSLAITSRNNLMKMISKTELKDENESVIAKGLKKYISLGTYSFFFMVPFTVIELFIAPSSPKCIPSTLFYSGTSHFLYNFTSFGVLAIMTSVSHSMANIMKRVAIITIASVYFGNTLDTVDMIGILLSCFGSMLYVLTKHQFTVSLTIYDKFTQYCFLYLIIIINVAVYYLYTMEI